MDVSPIPIASKLFLFTLVRGLYSTREEQAPEERAGRGCIYQIPTIRQVLEKRFNFQKPRIIVILDTCNPR